MTTTPAPAPDADHTSGGPRRLVAAGIIARHQDRTFLISVTAAGVTGSLLRTEGGRS
ncbi:hypothetical protein AB0K47_01280 [Streptomyces tirandamycinicus]|uniref:hypothetical protein n=1 Tax=Streptomyces TaxID=1883 RepID=UPI000366352C|nr:hypothetical protein [Streptomyces spongiicola]